MIARTAKYSELHQHVDGGTRSRADHQKLKAGEINIVMIVISSMVEAAPCRVFISRKVASCRVGQEVATCGRVHARNSDAFMRNSPCVSSSASQHVRALHVFLRILLFHAS